MINCGLREWLIEELFARDARLSLLVGTQRYTPKACISQPYTKHWLFTSDSTGFLVEVILTIPGSAQSNDLGRSQRLVILLSGSYVFDIDAMISGHLYFK